MLRFTSKDQYGNPQASGAFKSARYKVDVVRFDDGLCLYLRSRHGSALIVGSRLDVEPARVEGEANRLLRRAEAKHT